VRSATSRSADALAHRGSSQGIAALRSSERKHLVERPLARFSVERLWALDEVLPF
jgi:hypothetical protein